MPRSSCWRPGDLDPRVWRWLNDLQEMWPEVPDDLLVRVIPTGNWDGSSLPWNRRQRKRFRTCDSVIVHLFSGPDQSWWKRQLETKSRAVLCVDKEANLYQDLLRDEVASYCVRAGQCGQPDWGSTVSHGEQTSIQVAWSTPIEVEGGTTEVCFGAS